jgi:hypothetical protein
MNRLSAIDAFAPAWSRVGTMLLKPFRLGTWLKMGFIGMLGGGLATANGNFGFRFSPPHARVPSGRFPSDPLAEIQQAIRSVHLSDYFHLIVTVLICVLLLSLIFLYLFCRFRFVLFDSVISGRPAVGHGWRQYASQANRYFGFWLAFRLVNVAVVALIVGVPLWRAYQNGVFSGDNSIGALFELLASIALGAIAASIAFAIVSTLMKDFIMPIMALDNFTLGDAWSALWRVIASEPRAWAGYLGMKLVLAICAGLALAIGFVMALLPAALVIGIPVGLLVGLGIALKSSATTVALVIFFIAGMVAAAGIACLYMVLIAPLTVFFASFAFYFFGGRYPKLGALLPPLTPPAPVPQMAGTPSRV